MRINCKGLEEEKYPMNRAKVIRNISITMAVALLSCDASVFTTESSEFVNQLVIYADRGEETIDPNIYGHFAEHLGGCIYGGVWVGED